MKYFTIAELCYSDTARMNNIRNVPPLNVEVHLKEMTENLLDPLRQAFGNPIRVTSGYRGPELNRIVGGSKTSAHFLGYAVDIVPSKKVPIKEFKKFVLNWLLDNDIPFDQYIDEKSGDNEWVHLGYKNNKGLQRRQIMKYENGKYSYL